MKKFLYITLFLAPLVTGAQSVDLISQGETYVPPFYEGRSLWSNQSFVTIMAIPQDLGSAGALVYRWTKDGTVLGNITGIGRQSIRFEDTIFSKPQSIKVEIINDKEEILAENSIIITPVKPTLLVYEDNPLYGYLLNREVGDRFRIKEEELTLSAFPLFTTPSIREGAGLIYRWSSGNSSPETDHTVTYRIPEESSGSASVSVKFENTSKILLPISKTFLIEFGE